MENLNIYSLSILFCSLSILLVLFVISNWALTQTKKIKLKNLSSYSSTSPIYKYIIYITKYRERNIYGTYIYIITLSFLLGSLLYWIIEYLEHNATFLQPIIQYNFYCFLVVSILFLTIVILLIDFFKGLFEFNAEKSLALLSPFIYYFGKIISFIPVSIIAANNFILRFFGRNEKRQLSTLFSQKEIKDLIEESSDNGLIEDEEKELIKGVLDFSNTLVKDIMTPRHQIAFVDINASINDVVKTFSEEAYSRLVVCDKDLDNVKGIVLVKDVLSFMFKNSKKECLNEKISTLIREVYFVQETKEVNELLSELRQQGIHLAIVLDEHGGVQGLVTIEDLLEEIVGDIMDEHDMLEKQEEEIIKNNNDEIIVSSLVSVHDFNDENNPKIPEGEYETIGGFVIKSFSRMPKEGEGFDFDGYHFEVQSMLEHRIDKIKISKIVKDNEEI